jgi:predicted alpha/beta-fold hydrolase
MGAATTNRTRVSTSFEPNPLIREGNVQTVLSKAQHNNMDMVIRRERPLLLDAGYDYTGYDVERTVRLLAYYTATPAPVTLGLVLMLHGWEGCSHSTYNLITTRMLLLAGYDVMRLNLRDHGPGLHVDPHALNKGIFFGTLIDEAATATQRIAEMAGDKPFYIVGASMGGNFALRLAIRHSEAPFHNLRQVVAFNPAIDPARATKAMDARSFYRYYFRRRWVASLRRKQELFSDVFDFSDVYSIPLVYDMTDILVRRLRNYASADDYFSHYTLRGDVFRDLTVPTTIITAADDPVVPVVDFYGLAPHPLLDVQIHAHGGHVGFVDIWPVQHYLPQMLLDVIRQGDRMTR